MTSIQHWGEYFLTYPSLQRPKSGKRITKRWSWIKELQEEIISRCNFSIRALWYDRNGRYFILPYLLSALNNRGVSQQIRPGPTLGWEGCKVWPKDNWEKSRRERISTSNNQTEQILWHRASISGTKGSFSRYKSNTTASRHLTQSLVCAFLCVPGVPNPSQDLGCNEQIPLWGQNWFSLFKPRTVSKCHFGQYHFCRGTRSEDRLPRLSGLVLSGPECVYRVL